MKINRHSVSGRWRAGVADHYGIRSASYIDACIPMTAGIDTRRGLKAGAIAVVVAAVALFAFRAALSRLWLDELHVALTLVHGFDILYVGCIALAGALGQWRQSRRRAGVARSDAASRARAGVQDAVRDSADAGGAAL